MEAPCFKVTMAWKHNCEASSSKQTHHTIITSSYTKKKKDISVFISISTK